MNTRIVLVDDHPMLRQGVRQILEQQPDLILAGEAASGQSSLPLIKARKPDMVIMDVHLPDISGLEASRQILAQSPSIKIIVFSADADRLLVDEALQIGICGYLLKSSVPEELVRAIRMVMEGRLYLCPELASHVFDDYRKMLAAMAHSAKPLLTDREKQVLCRVAEGLQNKEIADLMKVSIKSVEKSRSRVMRKLQCHSAAELTRYAVREGLVCL
jgi:DNA-binding NarL/FixJ family response regulator